ncbi:MAG: hypothetical protein HDKAJFGB_02183 [Anaerolineae bacterium]|nr:hypothetical protein [Anaerolineae bacterium]RIK23902.1 MAG: hypothetical protein DCC52_12825 [Chloroflexota bacterium]
MAEQWEVSVKNAAQKLADALQDAATLTVKTEYVEAATAGGAASTPLSLTTEIHLDADSLNSVPVTRVEGVGLQVNQDLYQIHASNVQAAMDYRLRVLNALLDAVQTQLR